jgi:hypothetical protein
MSFKLVPLADQAFGKSLSKKRGKYDQYFCYLAGMGCRFRTAHGKLKQASALQRNQHRQTGLRKERKLKLATPD